MLGEWNFQPSNAFILGLALIVIVFLWRSRRYFALGQRLTVRPAAVPEPPPRPASGEEMPSQYRRWETLMHETARDLAGQLDSKMSALQALIREAHQAANRLEAALEAGRQVPAAAPTAPSARQPALAPQVSAAGEDPRYDQIYTLADYGFDPSEIAHRIGSSRGEIELILGLRNRR